MPRIRPFAPGYESALNAICVLTGDAGADATGQHGGDDGLLPDVYLRPYLARHPDHAWVVESDHERAVGYLVLAPDTEAFEGWFRDRWWPSRAAAHDPEDPVSRQAANRRPGAEPLATRFPAHLHIDLLPEAQGKGWGRRLIETALDDLRAAGVPGVHLVASARNVGALAFYPRVGFERMGQRDDAVAFARSA